MVPWAGNFAPGHGRDECAGVEHFAHDWQGAHHPVKDLLEHTLNAFPAVPGQQPLPGEAQCAFLQFGHFVLVVVVAHRALGESFNNKGKLFIASLLANGFIWLNRWKITRLYISFDSVDIRENFD